jgi:uncharacterized membrane protein YhhN
MSKNPAIYLYLTAGFLFLLTILLQSEEFMLVTKPIIIPSILFYYYLETKGRVNSVFVISLILFFIGDMLFLINFDDFYIIGLLIFLLPYLFVIHFLYQDIKEIIAKRKYKKIDYTFIIILLLLVNLLVTVLMNLESSSFIEEVFFLLFGIELVAMGVMAAMIYFHSSIKRNFFLAITVATFIMSDLFFILNKNVQNLLVFELINGLAQTASYYFYVKYFLERKKQVSYES